MEQEVISSPTNITNISVIRIRKKKRCGRVIWQSYKGKQYSDEKAPIDLALDDNE